MSRTLDVRHTSPHVAEVWLNRPEVRNAFNDGVVAELTQAFTALAAQDGLRAIVLAGHGKAFCAGADLSWMRSMSDYTWAQNHADASALAQMLWTLWSCPVPVVGRIQGDCYAGGVGLAAVCDVVVAAEGVHFCLSEAKLGLLPATIGPYVVRAIGEAAARRYFSRPNASAPHAPHNWAWCTKSCRPNGWTPRWQRSSPPWWPTARPP
jgi:methylglutaconyl-CoA hydratase